MYTQYTLGDVCSRLSSGKSISASEVTDKGLFPVYGGNGLRGYTDKSNFTGECAIIGRQGAFCGNVHYFSGEAYMTEHAVVVCANEEHNTRYLAYLLSQMNLGRLSGQSAQPGLSVKTLAKQCINLPPLEIQNKIVSVLASLDSKIDCNQKINDNLEQQASALFKSWFIDFKQVPNCDFVNSEIGLIPNDWRVYKLSDFLPVITGKKNANVSSDKGAYPFFSCSQGISWTNDYSFDGHAILVAGNGDFNVKWYNGKFDAYQRTYVLIPYNKRFTSWLYYAVKYNLFNITRAARGSVIKFITKGNLENFAFAGPKDLDSLDVIDTFTTINHTIDKKTQENYRLSALRDALLPKLMSGEIDISAVQF